MIHSSISKIIALLALVASGIGYAQSSSIACVMAEYFFLSNPMPVCDGPTESQCNFPGIKTSLLWPAPGTTRLAVLLCLRELAILTIRTRMQMCEQMWICRVGQRFSSSPFLAWFNFFIFPFRAFLGEKLLARVM